MVDALEKDIVGPGAADEVIVDAPLTKYIAGILYPKSADGLNSDQDNDLPDDDGEDFAPDPPIALANVRYPSSMGITFAVDVAESSVLVEASAAHYEELRGVSDDSRTLAGNRRRSTWRREVLRLDPVIIPVNAPNSGERKQIAPGLELYYRVRAAEKGVVALTTVLVNTHVANAQDRSVSRDSLSFFQIGIRVVAADSGRSPFIERRRKELSIEDDDLESYRLLYRNARTFAVGHGCAAEWSLAKGGERANEIRTAVVPRYELQIVESNSDISVTGLSMKSLGFGDWEKVELSLLTLCDGYESWIKTQEADIPSLTVDLRPVALTHIDACRKAVQRIRDGISVLSADPLSRLAFQYANRAMLQQRARTDWLKAGRTTDKPTESETFTWRPFQIAFILLSLPGIANPKSPDRDIADLLWFPTGGGKTEAYLGLIAFTIFLRRLRSKGKAAGVTVLMRYTLRLLTIQQFERASLLISACELIRATNEATLGRQTISVGLWVGKAATPNTRKACGDALKKLAHGDSLDSGNPMQLPRCLWCGAVFDHRNYWQKAADKRLMITCKQKECEFAKGLPVYLVDEDIYEFRPDLIIGTVDKFAALPWKPETASLFNRDIHDCPPPELIIQDELHLISGPLGTLTGLYETAVDALCTTNGVRPKVVASTATIRRAGTQTQALFDRHVRQFPPPAVDAGDSYFARETPSDKKGSRLYIGCMAPGASHSTLMIRAYAALLQAAKDVAGADLVRDTYWTLLGYFNSLRVLGGAMLQVQDDVTDRLEYVSQLLATPPRGLQDPIELTSRVPSAEIPTNLKSIEVRFPDPKTIDVLLATNMISVGVDVDRLGLMVVMGQPQATAEYIQATSRVGRRFPGLVVTLFNSARSRDRSHYENFISYHSALYRQVESTSVTPFSPRARDRGLHAVLVALARLLGNKFRPNASASEVDTLDRDLEQVKKIILDRAAKVLRDSDEVKNVEKEFLLLLGRWKAEVAEHQALLFTKYKSPRDSLLVEAYEEHPDAAGKFKTLRSLRDVDKSSDLYIVRIE